jgi:hypothetical protein
MVRLNVDRISSIFTMLQAIGRSGANARDASQPTYALVGTLMASAEPRPQAWLAKADVAKRTVGVLAREWLSMLERTSRSSASVQILPS